MGRNKNLVSDGVTVDKAANFQSFVISTKIKSGQLVIMVPKQIQKCLDITKDTILEVAIREVSFKYAKENYNIDFFPHIVVCPECGQKGTLSHFALYHVVVAHRKKEGKHILTNICFPKSVDTLINDYEIKQNLVYNQKDSI